MPPKARRTDDVARYTPTLTVAPTMLSNFLGFMLERNVFPNLKDKIDLAIPIADLAKAQRGSSTVPKPSPHADVSD